MSLSLGLFGRCSGSVEHGYLGVRDGNPFLLKSKLDSLEHPIFDKDVVAFLEPDPQAGFNAIGGKGIKNNERRGVYECAFGLLYNPE